MANPGDDVQRVLRPKVRAALAKRIGQEAAAELDDGRAALRLASIAPSEYLALQRDAQADVRAAALAEKYAPGPATPEELERMAKYEADVALAKRDYPAYKAQRDKEAAERIARQKAQKGR